MFIKWALMFVAVEAALTLIQFLLRKKNIKKSLRAVIIAAKLLAAVACSVIVMGGPVFFRPVQPIMVVIYAVLFTDAVAEIVYCIFLAVRKSDRKFLPLKILSLVFGVLFFVYGTLSKAEERI